MAVVGTEDIANWEKVCNFFLKKFGFSICCGEFQ